MPKIHLQTLSKQIYDAVSAGNIAEVKKLLESADEVGITHVVDSYVDLETGNSALHEAALLGNLELINLLLKYGADPNKTNKRSQTPLEALNKKTTNQTIKVTRNKEKISVDTSGEALRPFGLQHRQEIITRDNKIATVYGATSEGELCVWIKGNSEVTIFEKIKNRGSLIECSFKFTNKKSDQIHLSEKQLADTLTVNYFQVTGFHAFNPQSLNINCSTDTLKNLFNVAFLQRIKTPNGRLATVYGIGPEGNLCCLVDDEEATQLTSGTCEQDLIDSGYTISPEFGFGVIKESIILAGYKTIIHTINSDPQKLKKGLVPFKKYDTPTGIATFYGLSDDNKAILLNDKNDALQVIDVKEITPLYKEAKEKLESTEEPILETNLTTLRNKLRKLYYSGYILERIHQEPFNSLMEADEAKTTLDRLNRIVNQTEFSNEDQLKSELKKLLSERWEYIKDNPHLTYLNNTKSFINQLCIHIAQIIDPVHRNEILIPTLEYKNDTNDTNINQLEFGQFILTSDGKQFIDLISLHNNAFQVIKQGQEDYYQVSEFNEAPPADGTKETKEEKSEVSLEDETKEIKEKLRQLNEDEIKRLHLVPHAKEFIDIAEKRLKASKLTAQGVLQELRKGLLLGDVTAKDAYEYDAGLGALERLVWFHEKYSEMPPEHKAMLDNPKLKVRDETLGEFIKKRLLLEKAGKKNEDGELDAYYCLKLNGRALEEFLQAHGKELEEIPMGNGLFAEVGTEQLDIPYKKVIETLRNPDICSHPVSIEDDVRFFSTHKVEIDEYIKRILNNEITGEPSFLVRIKNPLFNIQQVKNVLNKYLDYPPATKSKLIKFMLDRPTQEDLCLKKIEEISEIYIYESVKILTGFLLNGNLCEIKFSEDYLKIISRFTNIYGSNIEKLVKDNIRELDLTIEKRDAAIYLYDKINSEMKLLSEKNEDIAKDNLLGMTCARNLLTKFSSNLFSKKISDEEVNEVRNIHFILKIQQLGSGISTLIDSELEKINVSATIKNVLQVILKNRSQTKEEISDLNKLINLILGLEKIVDLLLNKDSNIYEHEEEYYDLVNQIKSNIVSELKFWTILDGILSEKPISKELKTWIMEFAKIMVVTPEGSIAEAARVQKKNTTFELIKPIINGLKKESISLQDLINLQDFIHKNHELFSSLKLEDIKEIISKTATDLIPDIQSDLVLLISQTNPDNYKLETVEERCKEINTKILLSHHILPTLLDQQNSIYDNPSRFKALMYYLYDQSNSRRSNSENSIPRKTPGEIIDKLKLFPNQTSDDIKKRITVFLNEFSTKNESCSHIAEKIRLEHCGHEELRKEVKDFLGSQIQNLEKIQNDHIKSHSRDLAYRSEASFYFEKILGNDQSSPNTLRHLHASLDSGTIKLEEVQTKIKNITHPIILSNSKTGAFDKLIHWIQNIVSNLNELFPTPREISARRAKYVAQCSIPKNCNAFFSKAMSKDWSQPEEKIVPTVAITA